MSLKKQTAHGMVFTGSQVFVNHVLNLATSIVLADVIDRVKFEADPYKAAQGAHAVALLTEWKEYKTLDYQKIFDGMVQPAFLFDGRNHLDHQALHNIGFNVYSIGRASLKHI